MARDRRLSPALYRSERLIDAEARVPKLRLAWAALWTVCDRDGRFRWKPRVLRADAMPLDVDVDFAAVLVELAALGLVVRYDVGGDIFGAVPPDMWQRFQSPHPREAVSVLPAPPADAGLALGEPRDRPVPSNPSEPSMPSMPSMPPKPSKPSKPARTSGADAPIPFDEVATTTKPRPRKLITEQAGLVGTLARLWSEVHATTEVPKPVPTWGGEAARVIALSKDHGEDDVTRRWRNWLACSCEFSQGHPLKTFTAAAVFDRCLEPCRRCAPKRDVDSERRLSLGRRSSRDAQPCECEHPSSPYHAGGSGRCLVTGCGCRAFSADREEVSR